MSHLYSTRVTAVGGRHGIIESEDGVLTLELALPKNLGGVGGAANPEQLFAGGYSACFENALLRAAHDAGVRLKDSDLQVTAEVGLDRNARGECVLAAALSVTVKGVDLWVAEGLVMEAHEVCPYSNAIKGNVDVRLSVQVE